MKEKASKAIGCRNRLEWFETLRSRGISIESGHFPSRSGGLTAYSLFESGRESDITLLVHGTGNDHLFSLQSLIEELVSEGQSVLSIDLPGHGIESSTILKPESFWESAEDLKVYLRVKGFDKRNLNAIGYSLGGVFLLNALDQEQLSFRKIVLMAVPLHVKFSLGFLWHEFLSVFSASFRGHGQRFGWSETIPAFGSFRREDFPLRLEDSYQKSYPEFVGELLKSRSPLSLTGKLGQNCLLILGARDRLAPPGDSVHWQSAAPGLSVLVVDRANHFLLPFQKPTIDAITHWMKT